MTFAANSSFIISHKAPKCKTNRSFVYWFSYIKGFKVPKPSLIFPKTCFLLIIDSPHICLKTLNNYFSLPPIFFNSFRNEERRQKKKKTPDRYVPCPVSPNNHGSVKQAIPLHKASSQLFSAKILFWHLLLYNIPKCLLPTPRNRTIRWRPHFIKWRSLIQISSYPFPWDQNQYIYIYIKS